MILSSYMNPSEISKDISKHLKTIQRQMNIKQRSRDSANFQLNGLL